MWQGKLAEVGHQVICVDVDKESRNDEKGISPIFEAGLEELMRKNLRQE